MSGSVQSVQVDGVDQGTFVFSPWTAIAHRSHILGSKCSTPVVCLKKEDVGDRCLFCQFSERVKIPTFPDMTFARNKLTVRHDKGFGIEFNCEDALRTVCADQEDKDLQVAAAAAWQEARSDCAF